VGAGVAGGAVAAGGGGCFFLQPATATRATSSTTGMKTRKRRFNALLLLQFQDDITILCLCSTGRTASQQYMRMYMGRANSIVRNCAVVFGRRRIRFAHEMWLRLTKL
jgi:hypothetical protein